ncbi:hypothetical protein EUTSA_v10014604mg [Eutrema salsugineum]|uniref:Uncharacterized protein n=1 Tax=Eutrema salsugineum TaxID=72664 RepID=V4LJS6_EUTSA|nr:uncharacterized protein LOC18018358 [Eutrema salsugineum]ESQ40033.1 hypothetical protein EUTSA_v10014604mg [Eutrema salsugineum]
MHISPPTLSLALSLSRSLCLTLSLSQYSPKIIMPNSGSERPASLRKQDTATFPVKLPSTKQRFSSPASACPSFRIYYYDGAAGSIPFEWESHPGTPKHPSSELPPPPPLTPPPSHFSFSGDQIRRGSKKPFKKILALVPTRLFWLSSGGHNNNNKAKKLSASPPSMSERVLIDDNEYHLFKFQTKRKVIRRFSSFDSSATSIDHYPIRRSQSTSCFGFPTCFTW